MPEQKDDATPSKHLQCRVNRAQHLRFMELRVELGRQQVMPADANIGEVIMYAIDFTLDFLRNKQAAKVG